MITQKGQVHGKTLNAIRDRIDRFHAMNVFGDADAATKLTRLKQQIAGLSGQDPAQQPDVAAKLSKACQCLKNHILNPDNVSQLTGRLKRRVMLDWITRITRTSFSGRAFRPALARLTSPRSRSPPD
ncbi:MAG: hypothetical protein ACYSUI_04510 [Planctomycetota bacterium]|jgi:hypothetical protein